MSSVTLKFGGKLIEELSQKIPSSLFALNELIKNAYDAFSPDVTVKIEPSKQTITVSDHGNGMRTSEVEKLFHISQSSKSYGHVIEQDGIKRITQGSKGLGFLAAFKFGDKVEWVTCKNGTRSSFSLKKSDLVSKEDLTGTEIPIKTDSYTQDGTTITIYANKEEISELLEDLSDTKIAEKLVATIVDDSFDIKIEVENQKQNLTTRKLKPFITENEESQLFHVKYSSDENEVKFYHRGKHVSSFPFTLQRTDYSIDLDLIIFHFDPGKNSRSISSLNKRVHDNALYPLVYVNGNLFNNIVIFDPDVLRKKKSGETLAQMIGRVSLLSQSEEMDFNSDRTNFVDSNLTKSLVKDLKSLNQAIQTNGAALKKKLNNDTPGKKVPLGKAVLDPSSNKSGNKTASILIDRQKPITFYTPSNQIDLNDYIFQIRNSLGNEIDKKNVCISIDGQQSISKVLPSIEKPCEKRISFRYQDISTNLVSNEVVLNFKKKFSNISGQAHDQDKSIFTIESESGYTISLETVSGIIHAIDKAFLSKSKDEFLPLIACSMRAIYEVSADKLFKTRKQWFNKFDKNKLSSSVKKEANDKLLLDVAHIVILLKLNARLVTEVSIKTDISYSTLNNLLDLEAFKYSVKSSHIGAHQSTRYLSKPRIEACADTCGLFSVICDVLINIDDNKLSTLSITNVSEVDLNNYLGIVK
jgi:regulator of replication initiation timing